MKVEAIPARQGEHHLHNYEDIAADFDWTEVEKEFSWYESGKVNMAY